VPEATINCIAEDSTSILKKREVIHSALLLLSCPLAMHWFVVYLGRAAGFIAEKIYANMLAW
jgi:hypothetical protein